MSVPMHIKSLHLRNFKQFSDFSLSARDVNVLVGPNNSGKSTTLDALRICQDVLRFASRRVPTNERHNGDGICQTYTISESLLSIPIVNVVRNFRAEDAEIIIKSVNGPVLIIRLHQDHQLKAYIVNSPRAITNSRIFSELFPIKIVVVPTLGPFESEENYLTDETVQRNEGTRLAHRNFRNIIYRMDDGNFQEFSRLVRDAWVGIEIRKPAINTSSFPRAMDIFYEENRMPREIGWSGFGLQVWMQMMLHMIKGGRDKILVMDEPDIYLHPDLQKKLFRISKERFGQLFIGTHSTEIINEANPGQILSISSAVDFH